MNTTVTGTRDEWQPSFFIVDDQELNVNLLERILRRQGFSNIVSTTDSTEALTRITEFQPDLILLDYHMPNVNGLDILAGLKSIVPATDYLPVIVLTADTSAEAKQQALSQGAKDFLAKPLDRAEVILRIENLLETRFLYLRLQQQNEELQDTLTKLKSAQSQLVGNEKMASLGQLTAGIAHEINNPINFVSSNIPPLRRDIGDVLSIVQVYAEVVASQTLQSSFAVVETLKRRLDLDVVIKEIGEILDGVEEGAKRTAEIVKHLRSFSRLDEDVLKHVSVQEGLDTTLVLLRSKYEPRIRVIRNYEKVPPIDCYPGKLNQVFMNLLVNAIEAIPDSGIIRLDVRSVDDEVEIRVSDSGVGMTDAVMHRIFEPFFTTKDVGVGTGLGLSITFGIIERHHGSIRVESTVGVGTTFIIRLPIVP